MPHLYQTENWRLWNRWESTHWFFTPENICHRIYVHTVFTTRIRCCRQLGTKKIGPASNGLCIHGVSHHKYLVIYLDIDGAGNRVSLALQRQEASFPPLHLCNRYIIAILFGHRSNCFNQFQHYSYQKRHHCQQTTNFYEPQHPTGCEKSWQQLKWSEFKFQEKRHSLHS